MGHDRHTQLYDRPLRAFIANRSGTASEQAGNMAFDYRTAVTAGTSQLHLMRRAFAVQVGFIEDRENLFGRGLG
ncbi:MAG: hypothetical protein M3255_09720 [Pseudomonadota bacterium]|nr:hypothetical protein [Pseudomonadota bacterium]